MKAVLYIYIFFISAYLAKLAKNALHFTKSFLHNDYEVSKLQYNS